MSVPILDHTKFYKYVSSELEILRKHGDIPIQISGNPYSDNAIMIVTAYHRRIFDSDLKPTDLKLSHLIDVFSYGEKGFEFGRELAWINKSAKASFMMFPNNPLIHPSTNNGKKPETVPQDGKASPSIYAEHLYVLYLLEFLKSIPEDSNGLYCVQCGSPSKFDFSETENQINVLVGGKDVKFSTGLSRSWYPLVGTITNEAQAYHGYAEQPNICGKCLFLVHFLPMGSRLFKGNLLLFQTSDIEITYQFAEATLDEFLSRYAIRGTESVVSPGKGERSLALYTKLLDIFRIIAGINGTKVMNFRSSLMLWMFSNAGTGANSEVEQLPNRVLQNLHQFDIHWGPTVRSFLKNDEKAKRLSFVDSLKRETEYLGFYVNLDNSPPPLNFYEVYQREVVGRSTETLSFYRNVSREITKNTDSQKIENILKKGDNNEIVQLVLQTILTMVIDGTLPVSLAIHFFYKEFPNKGFKPFEYYLHPKAEFQVEDTAEIPLPEEFSFLEALANAYYIRASQRGGYNPHSFLSALNGEKSSLFHRLLNDEGSKTPGLSWMKLRSYENSFKSLISWSKIRHFILRLYIIEQMKTAHDEPILIDVKPFSSIVELEEEALLSEGLLQSIYQYLTKRHVEEEFSLNRAVLDLRRLLSESRRSLDSLVYYLEQKGIEANEQDFYESFELSESYHGSGDNRFSWYKMKNQLINFLDQLVLIDGWSQQLEMEITA